MVSRYDFGKAKFFFDVRVFSEWRLAWKAMNLEAMVADSSDFAAKLADFLHLDPWWRVGQVRPWTTSRRVLKPWAKRDYP